MEIGKTLRDEIAISVLSDIVKQSGQLQYRYGGCKNILDEHCALAYMIADAMMDHRNREHERTQALEAFDKQFPNS